MTNEITFEATKPDENKQVKVTFKMGDKSYERNVNACYDSKGKFSKTDTDARILQVLNGVAAKLSVGAIEFLSEEELAARAAPIDEVPSSATLPTESGE